MANSKVTFSIYVFLFAHFVHFAIGGSLFQSCSTTSGNFTGKSIYKRNLNKLLNDLKSPDPETGFCLSFAGRNPDKVFGLSQCRAMSQQVTMRPVFLRQQQTFSLCQNTKAASIWYDNCFLGYSDSRFAGTINTEDGASMPNLQKASDPNSFFPNASILLSQLSGEASALPKLFAAGERDLGNSQKIFGFVDCTRNLSSFHCKLCIDLLVSFAGNANLTTLGSRNGGRIVALSCNIRFETFPFLDAWSRKDSILKGEN